ncbi:hypothetical protein F8388_001028 [Cannabis sativa]|uniref:RNase H type-1 domain-containing protein n=1 Tax=Cannabis sativa TaxID=3483 RepID=A0A7J6DZ38_CANSA|nr:hypothetical protein F8388_001028 [Cannabis sativa]
MELHLATDQAHPYQKHSKDIVRWSPPPPRTFIINTDASLIDGQPGCGLGLLLATDFIPGCLSVLLAETMAIRLALKLAETRSLQNMCIASDSQTVVKALTGNTRINTDWGLLVDDWILASKRFHNLSFIFSPRNCNKVAHCLANWGRLYHVTGVWTTVLPNCATTCLKADVPLGASL